METLGQAKQRHKLELRTLHNDIKVFQKKAKKDRLSKKDIEDMVNSMMVSVKDRQNQELKAYDAEKEENAMPQSDAESKSLELLKQAKTQARAQRKREAKKREERERRERVEEANKSTISQRQIEADIISAQLSKYGLKIKDIPSDGHCMYHAVADQIKQKNLSVADGSAGFQFLRKLTSEYMLAHSDDFMPFMALDDSYASLEDAFATYCDRLANTADWGGQLELRALACALRTPIEVFSAESDVLVMGGEFMDEHAPKLQLTYHLHYYTLGEHFNSVTPA